MVVGMRQTNRAIKVGIGSSAPKIAADRPQCPGDHEEGERQSRQCHGQRELIGCFLPDGSFDQGNHAVEKRLACAGGDTDFDLVRKDARAARDTRPVTSGLPNDGRGFTGDSGFVDGCSTLDHLPIAGDDLARGHQYDIAFTQFIRTDLFLHSIGHPAG